MFGCGGSEVDQREGTEQRTQVSPGTQPPPPPTLTTPDPHLASLQPNLVKILPWLMPSRERGGKDGGAGRTEGNGGFGEGTRDKSVRDATGETI